MSRFPKPAVDMHTYFQGKYEKVSECVHTAQYEGFAYLMVAGAVAFSQGRKAALHELPLLLGGFTQWSRTFSASGITHCLPVNLASRSCCVILTVWSAGHERQILQNRSVQENGHNVIAEDPFVDSITATAGPAAYYKEHRTSGLYKKVSDRV